MKKIILPAILAIIVFGLGYKFFSSNRSAQSLDQFANTGISSLKTVEVGKEESNKPVKAETIKPINNQKIMNATLHTSMGDIEIEFDNVNTPNTVANFVKLAGSGFYDLTKFHRVIKGFMDQGGDPLSKDDSQMAMWGRGGPGYQFADEITAGNSNDTGTISMANAGPNTNGSQFFINVAPNYSLDTKHTVFGRVTSGMDVVMAINSTETDASDRPVTPIVITSITLK